VASPRKRNQIAGQFAARPIEMMQSPAYRVLSRAAHQILARVEIEHAHHGGADNGHLPVTYEHFVEYGLDRKAVPPAIRELAALGFIEVTQRGCGGNADFRRPSHYRLTYRHAKGETGDGTHEWRKIETVKQAEERAQHARRNTDSRAREIAIAHHQKQKPGGGLAHISGAVSTPANGVSSGVLFTPTSSGALSTPTSISRLGSTFKPSGGGDDEHPGPQSDGNMLPGDCRALAGKRVDTLA
jgi:hypothetical protein